MKSRTTDQLFESTQRTEEIEKQKAEYIGPRDFNGQADESSDKTKEVEEAKKRPGGAL
ncbi:hypothetical protein [Granulicella rosea]|uniref:hypothetical protein n=1 Tax=Granulicella rosea TaxID=474952 RepID=UPI0015961551|nr:hypothetical protein [Granulicella rosea]